MIIFILILGLVLRLININQGFWLDEAIGMIAQKSLSYSGIIFDLMSHDNHPPLYYLVLKFWVSIFGSHEIKVRFLSVLFGIGTIYITYLIGKEVFANTKNKIFGLTAPIVLAILISTSGLHVYYSQEARMYSMATLFTSVSILSFLKLIKKDRIIEWIIFSFSIVLLGSTDYVPFFLYPMFLMTPIILKKGKAFFFKVCISFLPLTLLFIWWLPTFKIQIAGSTDLLINFPLWKTVVGGATLKQLTLLWIKFVIGRITFVNKIFYVFVVAISSVIFAIPLFRAINKRQEIIVVWLWLMIPTTLTFLASFFIPAFIYFRFLFILPAFYILITEGMFSNKKYSRLFLILILSVNIFTLGVYYLNRNLWREDWKTAIPFVENLVTKDEIILFDFPKPVAPYFWYTNGKVIAEGALTSVFAQENKTQSRVSDLTQDKKGVWYFVYLRDISDPENLVFFELQKIGYLQKDVFGFRGIGDIIHFVKK